MSFFLKVSRNNKHLIRNFNHSHQKMANSQKKQLVVDAFCMRQWDSNYVGTRLINTGITPEILEQVCNDYLQQGKGTLQPGYAPFCKHLFLPNTLSDKLKSSVVEITKENVHLLKSAYEARTPKELPVLVRWMESKDLPGGSVDALPKAKWLDVILYSREQIRKENEATGTPTAETDAPWGIISVKSQDDPFELPMTPITMMRNALGKEEGGSGVTLNREEYDKAVKYWENHVFIR
jgi:hypothetical protein